jgi:serine/threonine protein phosphatase PrpC
MCVLTLNQRTPHVCLQQDAHCIHLNLEPLGANGHPEDGSCSPSALFGVFDGHVGHEVAEFCARHMVSGHVLMRGGGHAFVWRVRSGIRWMNMCVVDVCAD